MVARRARQACRQAGTSEPVLQALQDGSGACGGDERAGPLARLEARTAHAPRASSGWRSSCRSCSTARSCCIDTRSRSAQPNERRALQIARALSADIDREITAIITTLETLATADALAVKDFKSFHVQAKEALRSRPVERARHRRQSPPARQYAPALGHAAARQRSSRARPGAHRAGDRAALRHPISSWAPSPSAGSSPSACRCGRARTIQYALVMSLEPERLVEILKGESLPPGWLAAVSDRKNINMARTRLAEQFLGRPVPEESLQPVRRQARGRHHDHRLRGPALAAGLSPLEADRLAGRDLGAAVGGRGAAAAGLDLVPLVRRRRCCRCRCCWPSASAG